MHHCHGSCFLFSFLSRDLLTKAFVSAADMAFWMGETTPGPSLAPFLSSFHPPCLPSFPPESPTPGPTGTFRSRRCSHPPPSPPSSPTSHQHPSSPSSRKQAEQQGAQSTPRKRDAGEKAQYADENHTVQRPSKLRPQNEPCTVLLRYAPVPA